MILLELPVVAISWGFLFSSYAGKVALPGPGLGEEVPAPAAEGKRGLGWAVPGWPPGPVGWPVYCTGPAAGCPGWAATMPTP